MVAKKILKIVKMSALITALMVPVGVLYSFAVFGEFVPRNVFDIGLLAGGVITASGLVKFASPIFRQNDKLIDHSTYVQRTGEEREHKRTDAYELIFYGIGTLLTAGVAQLLVSLI